MKQTVWKFLASCNELQQKYSCCIRRWTVAVYWTVQRYGVITEDCLFIEQYNGMEWLQKIVCLLNSTTAWSDYRRLSVYWTVQRHGVITEDCLFIEQYNGMEWLQKIVCLFTVVQYFISILYFLWRAIFKFNAVQKVTSCSRLMMLQPYGNT
jgi:hypothetical protein